MTNEIEHIPDKSAFLLLVKQMPPQEQAEYNSYFSLTSEACFIGRTFIVYDLINGEPTNLDTFRIHGFQLGENSEPFIEYSFKDSQSPRNIASVGLTPSRYRDRELFLSVPQRFEFRWAGQTQAGSVSFRPHFAILIKTRSRADRLAEGVTGCVTPKRFQALFPDY